MESTGQSAETWLKAERVPELPCGERHGILCRVGDVASRGRLRGLLLFLPLRQDDVASSNSATPETSRVGLFTADEVGSLVLWLMRRFSENRASVAVKLLNFESSHAYASVGDGVDSGGGFYKLTEEDGYDLPFPVAIVPPKLAINWSYRLPDSPCALCNKPCTYGVGPRLVLERSAAVICHGCGQVYAPELVYMIDPWQPAQASDGRDGSSDR